MDYGDHDGGGFGDDEPNKPPTLPADLPTSLDDRRVVPTELVQETEMYDGWQGAHRLLPLDPLCPAANRDLRQANRNS
jgi:hypothetical protein